MKVTSFQEPVWICLKGEVQHSFDKVRITPCKVDASRLLLSSKVEFENPSKENLERQLTLSPLAEPGGFTLYIDSSNTTWALVNIGDISKCTREFLLKTFAALGRFLLKKSKTDWYLDAFPQECESDLMVESALEGLLLSQYPVSYMATGSGSERVASIDCFYPRKPSWNMLEAASHGVHLARSMINTNADQMTPEQMAQIAVDVARRYADQGVECHVLDEHEMAKERMSLLLAVARASRESPRLVILKYTPEQKKLNQAPIAWVGKGISYDTGGFSIKPQDSMKGQRADMSGAATVLGAFEAAVRLKSSQPLIAVLVCAENAIGSNGYKLGDTYVSRSGKTVEVVNTDAEGRLVLADAFDYVQEKFSPQIMIDLATLTGAAIVALGHEVAAILSPDESLSSQLIEAGKRSGERLWPLPLYDEYKEYLSSEVADMKNAGPRVAGTCVAGVFLKQFVRPGVVWAHLDIAGVAFAEKERFHFPKLATGFGVRTLLTWLFT